MFSFFKKVKRMRFKNFSPPVKDKDFLHLFRSYIEKVVNSTENQHPPLTFLKNKTFNFDDQYKFKFTFLYNGLNCNPDPSKKRFFKYSLTVSYFLYSWPLSFSSEIIGLLESAVKEIEHYSDIEYYSWGFYFSSYDYSYSGSYLKKANIPIEYLNQEKLDYETKNYLAFTIIDSKINRNNPSLTDSWRHPYFLDPPTNETKK